MASNSENFWVNSPKGESNWIRAAPTKASTGWMQDPLSEHAMPTPQGIFSKSPTNLRTAWQTNCPGYLTRYKMNDFLWCFATQPDVLSRGQPSLTVPETSGDVSHWNWSLAVRSTLSSVGESFLHFQVHVDLFRVTETTERIHSAEEIQFQFSYWEVVLNLGFF